MEVFAFREELVAKHERSSRSFPAIQADDVAREVSAAPAGGRSRPAPHVRLNRHFGPGGWGDNLIGEGTLDAECAKIFRFKHVNDTFGARLLRYRRQTDAVAVAAHKALLYYAVTGLGLDTASAARRAQDQRIELPNPAEPIARTPSTGSASRMEG